METANRTSIYLSILVCDVLGSSALQVSDFRDGKKTDYHAELTAFGKKRLEDAGKMSRPRAAVALAATSRNGYIG